MPPGSESASFDDFTVENYFPDGRILWTCKVGADSPCYTLISNPTADEVEDVGYINKYITLARRSKKSNQIVKSKIWTYMGSIAEKINRLLTRE